MMKKTTLTLIIWLLLLYLYSVCPLANLYSEEKIIPTTKAKSTTNLVSMSLKDVNIEDALKIIAEASGMNIVLDKDVTAKVNINLKDVPWQTALDNILKTNELAYKVQDNIIRIMTIEKVKKEEEMVPLFTKIITLNFAKADVIEKSLSKMLSSRGSIQVNVPTNSLIINDSPEELAKIEDVANRLDIRTPQVMIEALIMSVKLTDTDKFGIQWTATHKDVSSRKITQSLQASSSILDIYYGKTILPSWNIDEILSLYREDKRVTILANPRVLTLDNLSAQIEITEQVPYTYTSSTEQGSTSTTQFKDVGIKLYVTPHITKDKFISLSVKAEQSYVASYVGTTNEPSIDSRKAETNFMLKDKETVVIGGLRKKDNTVTIDKIPLLGDIPILGKVFRRETKETTDTELLIFITPRIIEDALMTQKETQKLESSKTELSRDKAILEALKKMSGTSY